MDRHELEIRTFAPEVVEAALEFAHLIARTPRPFWENDQRVFPPEALDHPRDCFLPALPRITFDAVSRRAPVDQYGPEHLARQVAPDRSGLPVVACRNRARALADARRKRRPDENEVEMTRVVREEDSLSVFAWGACPTHRPSGDGSCERGEQGGDHCPDNSRASSRVRRAKVTIEPAAITARATASTRPS